MSGQFWSTVEQLSPHSTEVLGRPRIDERRVLSRILFVLRSGLRQDAPAVYGLHKTPTTVLSVGRGWGVLARIFRTLAQPGRDGETLMMDSARLKAPRKAASFRIGARPRRIGGTKRRPELQAAYRERWPRPAIAHLLPLAGADERRKRCPGAPGGDATGQKAARRQALAFRSPRSRRRGLRRPRRASPRTPRSAGTASG